MSRVIPAVPPKDPEDATAPVGDFYFVAIPKATYIEIQRAATRQGKTVAEFLASAVASWLQR